MQFPEVERVLGKAGRAETSTDPAPLSMMETVILLKPQIRVAQAHLVRSGPSGQRSRRITPDHISTDDCEMNQALQIPGVSNAWTMPIKNRIDMLTTGIRTPVGIKIFGADLAEIEQHRNADRARAAAGRGHPQRLCRARRRRLFPRFRFEARPAWRATA